MKGYFETRAEQYSNFYDGLTWNFYHRFYVYYRLKKILSLIKFIKPARILDVGCGPGKLLKELTKFKRVKLLAGCDNSVNMLKIAKKNANKKVKFYLVDADALPFPNMDFDWVFSIGVLPYMKQPLKGVREIYRVLSADGTACITYPYKKTLLSFFRENSAGIWLKKNIFRMAHYDVKYEKSKFIKIVEEVGFQVIAEERILLSEFLLLLKKKTKNK
ncbi:class I SAM-dependent methyltransferase [Patescibacteria group bacterium]